MHIVDFKLNLTANTAKPTPVVISKLREYNIDMNAFYTQYNKRTQIFFGLEIPVRVIISSVSNFELVLLSPSTSFLINIFLIKGTITLKIIRKILESKYIDLYPLSRNKCLKLIRGTLESMQIKPVL